MQHEPPCADVRVELVVPTAEERVGDVEPLAVEAELQHLRAAGTVAAVHRGRLAQQPADPDLTGEFRLRGVR